MSRFFAVVFGEGEIRRPAAWMWKEWIRSNPDEEMEGLVLHRAVRDRGGVHERLAVSVFETAPRGTDPERAKNAVVHTYTIHPN